MTRICRKGSTRESGREQGRRRLWQATIAGVLVLGSATALPAAAGGLGDMLGAIAGRGEFGRGRDLDDALRRLASQMNRNMPVDVGQGYRLERVTAEPGSELVYHYVMLDRRAAEVPPAVLNVSMAPLIRSRLCKDEQMAPLLKSGAAIGYAYSGSDGQPIGKLSFRQSDCASRG